jgi:TATA-box binding protein (TBP) (component of TFIID and TFIIIB)
MSETTYSSVANNSFSYILSLDEFRSSFPEEVRPSWVKITTITIISKFATTIDICKLRSRLEKVGDVTLKRAGAHHSKGFTWRLNNTTAFYNQITLKCEDVSTKSVKLFSNGSVQIAGARDLFDCKRIISQLSWICKKFVNIEEPPKDFRVVMINSNFSLNSSLNLMSVAEHFSQASVFKTTFQPDRYSAVKVKFKPAEDMKEITCSIFSTGKIIITGAETLKEIAFGYNVIVSHINERMDLRVAPTQEKDLFDDYHGYKVNDLISVLRQRGYKSWLLTTENRQINF